ncbi:uncharacterized protein [Physcomitrium patens]|uniref:Uncharacterized protein n=1 Tax=Physcomitrium patens TaxID=3218 RepID=A0A2K1K438_PHYPA|nr:hypothetical protein PHYPA_013014 [Physcomitrium patens]
MRQRSPQPGCLFPWKERKGREGSLPATQPDSAPLPRSYEHTPASSPSITAGESQAAYWAFFFFFFFFFHHHHRYPFGECSFRNCRATRRWVSHWTRRTLTFEIFPAARDPAVIAPELRFPLIELLLLMGS